MIGKNSEEEITMAMRKVFYGPEGIMLHHTLQMYDKESLLEYARDLKIRRTTGLRKYELAEKIANELLTPSVMRRRMATFTPEQRAVFEKAIETPFVPSEEERENACAFSENDYAFWRKNGEFGVPVDVAQAYHKLNTPEFQQYAKKMSWLSQCLYFGENIYGIFDKDVLLKVYNARRGFHITKDELEKMCNEFPADMMGCHIESDRPIIIAEYVGYSGKYKNLVKVQRGKAFYIPAAEQVMDYFKYLYLPKEPAYISLRKFFRDEFGMNNVEAEDECAEVWHRVEEEEELPDILNYFLNFYGELMGEDQVKKLVGLLQDAHNNTRLQIHRGFTPNEMMQKAIECGDFVHRPTVVPGSTHAANILKSASEELQAMGINVDVNGNATTIKEGEASKKIYPNDPCPCGSGKKFKKCCGR